MFDKNLRAKCLTKFHDFGKKVLLCKFYCYNWPNIGQIIEPYGNTATGSIRYKMYLYSS